MTSRLRLRRWLISLAVFLVAFGAFGFLAAPALLHSEVQKTLTEELGRPVSLGSIQVNPFALSVKLHDLRIFETDGKNVALGIGEIDGGVSLTSLFRLAPVLDELIITAPVVHVVRLAPSRFSFSDILERIAAKPKSNSQLQFSLNNFHLTRGQINFDDAVTGTHHRIENINLSLPLVSNIRHDADLFEQPSLTATVDGSPFALYGKTKFFAPSLDTSVAMHLERLDLPLYVGYSPIPLAAKVASGTVGADLKITFSRDANGLAHVNLSGQVELGDLRILHPDGSPAVTAQAIQVGIREIDLLNGNIDLDHLTILTPSIVAKRDLAGVDLMRFLGSAPVSTMGHDAPVHTVPHEEHANTTHADSTTPKAVLHIGQVTVKQGRLDYIDTTFGKPFAATLENIEVNATNLSDERGKTTQISIGFDATNNQTLHANLQVSLGDGRLTGHVNAANLRLNSYGALWGLVLAARMDDGVLDASGDLSASWASSTPEIALDHAALKISRLKLALAEEKEPVFSADEIDVDGLNFDLSKRIAAIDALRLSRPMAVISRDAHGVVNLTALLPPPGSSEKVKPTSDTPFSVALKSVAIERGSISFSDAAVSMPTPIRLDNLTFSAEDVRTTPGAPIPFELSASAKPSGHLKMKGTLVAAPFALDARIFTHQFDLTPVQAYVPEKLNVTLTHADLSLQGHLKFTTAPVASATFGGMVSVDNLVALDKVNAANFLNWRTLRFDHLQVTQPKTATIVSLGNVTLSDFYSRLIVNPDGRLNLQDIVAHPGEMTIHSVTTPETENVAPAAAKIQVPGIVGGSKTLAVVPSTASSASTLTPIIKMSSLTLDGGSINFTDNFIKPNYSTSITALSGTVSAVSSDVAAPADISLKGSIEGNGDLDISGKINPLAQPLFLDIAASATNIELAGLTPYAAKYAGYPIEKGKLSMKVKYHIENQRLEAQNSLFLDQLTFGAHVDSPSATKLPVLLAISLLKNSRGEINVDLPISGTLSDPKFSLGGVIIRVILNLLEKALVSPFQLLSSIGGGSTQDLGYINFAPGSAALDADAHAKIGRLATLLADRPALKLDVTGHADPTIDVTQARQARLQGRVRGEKFRELLHSNPQTRFEDVTVSADEYPKYLERLYDDMNFVKPKNLIGMTKSLPPEEMEKLILANMPINNEDLLSLASRRAAAVSSALVAQGKIPVSRIFLTAPKLSPATPQDKGKPSRVDFTLHP